MNFYYHFSNELSSLLLLRFFRTRDKVLPRPRNNHFRNTLARRRRDQSANSGTLFAIKTPATTYVPVRSLVNRKLAIVLAPESSIVFATTREISSMIFSPVIFPRRTPKRRMRMIRRTSYVRTYRSLLLDVRARARTHFFIRACVFVFPRTRRSPEWWISGWMDWFRYANANRLAKERVASPGRQICSSGEKPSVSPHEKRDSRRV